MVNGEHRASKHRARVCLAVFAAVGVFALAAVPVASAGLLGPHGSPLEQKLATRLRPRLLFDSHERWRPLEVEAFLAETFPGGGTHRACWKGGSRPCEPVDPAELHPGHGTPDYIDIHGDGDNGAGFKSPQAECRGPVAVDCNSGPRTAIYYRRTSHGGRWYWDYWWFLRFNDYPSWLFGICLSRFCFDHEGDWEGVTVVTTEQARPKIVAVTYAAHAQRVEVAGDAVPKPGGHPLVYVAEGTHASYPFPCSEDCKDVETLGGFHLIPEGRHDGAVAWGGDNPHECRTYECVRPLPEVGETPESAPPRAGGWAGWHGFWGETCSEGCGGLPGKREPSPRSPGVQTRYKRPWEPTMRASVAEYF